MASRRYKHSVLCALQLTIVVCGLSDSFTATSSFAQVQFNDLKKIAEVAVDKSLVNVHDYKFQRDGNHVMFSTGALEGEIDSNFPYKDELTELILAEHVRQKTKDNADFWGPLLKDVEGAIAQQFARRQERPSDIPFDPTQVWMGYDTPLQTWANRNGFRYNDTPSAPESRKFKVQLVSAPAGATIQILPWLDYQISVALKRKPPWRTITRADVRLTGTYYYFLRWTNGSKSGPTLFSVASNGKHTLK